MLLIKNWTLLELYTLVSGRNVTDKNDALYYNDSMTGVFMGWNGVVNDPLEQAVATENEIDVGTVPIFISCKNGVVGEKELYKLNTVAHRFGNTYVKKVLVATTLGKEMVSRQYFRECKGYEEYHC